MSFRRMVVFFTFIAIFTMAVRVSVDTDTWWHLRAGEWMLEKGHLLRNDPFSLTRSGWSWVYPGWLAQILLYQTFNLLGFAGLNLFTALMVVLAFAFVWPLLEVPVLMRAAVMILATTVSGVYWSARPQILSFALAGSFLWVLSQNRKGNREWLLFLPPLMAIWSNIHGGFAIGFTLIIIFLISGIVEVVGEIILHSSPLIEVWRKKRLSLLILIAVGLGCAAAVAVNPFGFQMLSYPFKTVSIGVLRDIIQEWQSPNFHQTEVQPFLWMFILTLVSMVLSQRRASVIEFALVIGFAYFGFMAGRNIPIFALVAAPVLAKHGYSSIEPYLEGRKKGPQLSEDLARRLNVVLILLFVFMSIIKIAAPLSEEVNLKAIGDRVPVEAVKVILEHDPPGNLFNSYNWGGYVLWALYPDYKSFVDGRTDLFGDEILVEYLETWAGDPGWEQVLEKWDIQLALLEVKAPLAKELRFAGWDLIYEDDMALVLRRDDKP